MTIKMKSINYNFFLLLFIFLNVLKVDAAEKIYQIEVSEVNERVLHGGFGQSNRPIGGVTEFFVRELSAPLISINGLSADKFKSKMIYIFKIEGYYLCSKNSYDKNCFECNECGMPDKQKILLQFDVANVGRIRKKLIKTLQYSSIGGDKSMVDFQFPQKKGSPFSLVAKHKDPYMMEVLGRYFSHDVHILKSDNDPLYYLCQQSNFSHQCFVCINCEKELEKIKAYKPPI